MKKNNLIILLSLVIFLFNSLFCSTSKFLTRKQARRYIENIVDTLFDPTKHSRHTWKVLDIFISKITPQILAKVDHYSYSSLLKSYDSIKILNLTIKESIKFIEQKSRNYAFEQISKYYYSGNKSEIADLVAKKITNQAWLSINEKSVIQHGALTKFIGTALKEKVNYFISQEHFFKKIDSYDYKDVYKKNYLKPIYTEYPVFDEYNYIKPIIDYPVIQFPIIERSYYIRPSGYASISFGKKPSWSFQFSFKL